MFSLCVVSPLSRTPSHPPHPLITHHTGTDEGKEERAEEAEETVTSPETPTPITPTRSTSTSGAGGAADQEPNSNSNSFLSPVAPGDVSPTDEPTAVVLINSIFHLLFLPDFTIDDPTSDFGEDDVDSPAFKAALMWAPGVGTSSMHKTMTNSTAFDINRIEVLRLMVAAFCDALFQNPERFDPCGSMWLEVATSVDAPYADIVLCSLMNTVLAYDPVGWGMPYAETMHTDTAKQLMHSAIQVRVWACCTLYEWHDILSQKGMGYI